MATDVRGHFVRNPWLLAATAGYALFGAPELGVREAAGSSLPDAITAALVLLFAVWAYYPFAVLMPAAWQPPRLRFGLVVIGTVGLTRNRSPEAG